eukprot:3042744-Pleurochrysis_carterae.AAC.4
MNSHTAMQSAPAFSVQTLGLAGMHPPLRTTSTSSRSRVPTMWLTTFGARLAPAMTSVAGRVVNPYALGRRVRKLFGRYQQRRQRAPQGPHGRSSADAALDAAGAVLMWRSIGGFAGADNSQEALVVQFQLIDSDADGVIRPSELQRVLQRTNSRKATTRIAQNMVNLADMDGDGYINFEEFSSLMQATYPSQYMIAYRQRFSV